MIHETAVVEKGAELGENVKIGAYSMIGAQVKISDNTEIDSHVIIKGKTTIGQNNYFGSFTSVGLSAQDKSHKDEDTETIIGDSNYIREYVSIHRGTSNGVGYTKIGNNNEIYAYSHFAHDLIVGDNNMFAHTLFAGHCVVGSKIVFGGNTAVHQFCKVGDYSMVGGANKITQDVLPFTMCDGAPAKLKGLNLIGLKRNGFSSDQIKVIKRIYKIIFLGGNLLNEAVEKIKAEFQEDEIVSKILKFIEESKRGLMRIETK